MSTYTVSYKDLEPNEAAAKALADIKSYLGEAEYERVTALLVEAIELGEATEPDHLRMPLMMIGVQGWPVRVWFDECKTLAETARRFASKT